MNINENKDIFGVMCILWTLSEFQNTFDFKLFFYRLEEYKTAAELALVIRKRYLSSS